MIFRHGLVLNLAILFLVLLLLLIIFGDKGIVDLQRLKADREDLIGLNMRIERKNQELFREVNRLKSDPDYIESIARRELGLVGKKEVIFKSRQPAKNAP